MQVRLKLSALLGAVAVASLIAVTPGPVQARASHSRGAAAPTTLGPAMPPPYTADLSCGPGAAGLAPWGFDRIEKSLSLDPAQRGKFDELKAASQKAIQHLNENCPTTEPANEPITPTGRVDAMERRLEAMLEAVRTVKPAVEDFYGSLSDDQKASLNAPELDADASAKASIQSGEPNDLPRYRNYARVHGRRHWGFRLPIPLPF
jgi:hypothetical protein